jgi:hypothetical protein
MPGDVRQPGPQLLDFLGACLPAVARMALALRDLVLSEAPDAEEVLYSVYAEVIVFKLPGRPGGAFCNVAACSRHVNLVFYRGSELPDPHHVMKGSGKKMRHIRFDSVEEVDRGFVRSYIRAAIEQLLTTPQMVRPKK